jgi:hypothetical protein
VLALIALDWFLSVCFYYRRIVCLSGPNLRTCELRASSRVSGFAAFASGLGETKQTKLRRRMEGLLIERKVVLKGTKRFDRFFLIIMTGSCSSDRFAPTTYV